jgi:hypothetical protein
MGVRASRTGKDRQPKRVPPGRERYSEPLFGGKRGAIPPWFPPVLPNDLTESESLLIGRDFGVVTDIETGPGGGLFVVSISEGAVYEIHRK